jgi:hypothetical protein
MLPVQSTLHGWSQLVISCFVYPLESKLLLLDTISALAPYSSSSSSTKERASSSVSFCNRRCLRFFHNHRRDLHCVWKQSNEKNCSTALWPLFSNGWYYSGRPRNSCPPLCRTCDWVNSSLLLQWFRFTATSSFVVFGLLIHDYAVVCLCVGFTATYCEKLSCTIWRENTRERRTLHFLLVGLYFFLPFINDCAEFSKHGRRWWKTPSHDLWWGLNFTTLQSSSMCCVSYSELRVPVFFTLIPALNVYKLRGFRIDLGWLRSLVDHWFFWLWFLWK